MNKIIVLFLIQSLAIFHVSAQVQTYAPLSGTFTSFDTIIKDFLIKKKFTDDVVATFAIAKAGKILYKQAYSTDLLLNIKPHPDLAMRIASCSKPFTAAAIRLLSSQNKISLDDTFYRYLTTGNNAISLVLPGKSLKDPRVMQVKISDLLNHTSGWDTTILGFDPMARMVLIAQENHTLNRPLPQQIIAWMLSNYPLQQAPPAPYAYSNFGYCILGRVIEKASGNSYINYLKMELMQNKMNSLEVAQSNKQFPHEVQWYLNENNPLSHFTLACNDQIFGYWVDSMDSHGGLLSSAPDLCIFLANYWMSGQKRNLGDKGYSGYFLGSLPSTWAIMYQHESGIDFAFLMNTRSTDSPALDELYKQLAAAVGTLPASVTA